MSCLNYVKRIFVENCKIKVNSVVDLDCIIDVNYVIDLDSIIDVNCIYYITCKIMINCIFAVSCRIDVNCIIDEYGSCNPAFPAQSTVPEVVRCTTCYTLQWDCYAASRYNRHQQNNNLTCLLKQAALLSTENISLLYWR